MDEEVQTYSGQRMTRLLGLCGSLALGRVAISSNRRVNRPRLSSAWLYSGQLRTLKR